MRRSVPLWLTVIGWIALPGTLLLVGRLVWEQTMWTYERGSQMVGFSLLHTSSQLLLLFYVGSLFLAHLFVLAVIVALVVNRIRCVPFRWTQAVHPIVVMTIVLLLYVPYGWWMFLLVKTVGTGGHGADFMVSGVAENQRYLVDAVLKSGTPVDAPYGTTAYGGELVTALNVACRKRNGPMAHHLLSKGANPDVAPDCAVFPEIKARMKKKAPQPEPESGRPKVEGTTVTVTP